MEIFRIGSATWVKEGGRCFRYPGSIPVPYPREAMEYESDGSAPPVPDLVARDFAVDRPDRLWVADITYIRTWSGWLYLAVVVEAFSRKVVGWSMADHLRVDLVLDTLNHDYRHARTLVVS